MNRETFTYTEARERVLAAMQPLPTVKTRLRDARGRALRGTVCAPQPLPPFSIAMVDGFAVRSTDLTRASGMSPAELSVVTIHSVDPKCARPLAADEAMRVQRGSRIPGEADAVVPLASAQSLGSGSDEKLWLTEPLRAGTHIRPAGEELETGVQILPDGREITGYDVALLAALGFEEVEVGARPRVVVVSAGVSSEASRPGAENGVLALLHELVEEAQARLVEEVLIPADPDEAARAIERAVAAADVVLTVGDTSYGDRDAVREILSRLDGEQLGDVAMEPGGLGAFASARGRLLFGLTGEPGSVASVFETLVRPALRKLQGFSHLDRPRVLVRMTEAIKSRAGRTDFVPATLEWRGDGWWAMTSRAGSTWHLATRSQAHALVVVRDATESLAEGEPAEAWILRWPETSSLEMVRATPDVRASGTASAPGPQWRAMNTQKRALGAQLVPHSVPATPGVYAWYRRGEAVYVGGAGNLRVRIWRDHLSEELSLARSELRRRAAEYLGLASAQEIHMGLYTPTEGDVEVVRRWIRSCDVAWIETRSEEENEDLEKALIGEWTPTFNKR